VPIRVADDVFGPPDWDGCYERTAFEVVSDAPPAALSAALHATGDRWMCLTDTGDDLSHLEWGGQEFHDALERLRVEQGREEEPYTPNYVYPVEKRGRGMALAADCKGAMTKAMADAVLRVLREELARAGVEDADVVAESPHDGGPHVYYNEDGTTRLSYR
jgi:hypothetical protein